MLVYLNGRFVSEKKAVVSAFDHGFLYGDGVFETLRAYGGVIFSLPLHLERLRRSALGIGLDPPNIPLERVVQKTLKKNGLMEALLRITLSRGPGPLNPSPRFCTQPTLVIFTRPFRPPPLRFYYRGLWVIVAKTKRNHPSALPPHIKSANFLNSILARREADAVNADEAILLNIRGELTEGSTSNLFFVKKTRVYTPSLSSGILEGITRKVVLALALRNGIQVAEGRFRPSALVNADEAFLTNTSWEIAPLTHVDGKPIGSGKPGVITKKLIALFQEHVREEVRAASTACLNSVILKGRSKGIHPAR